MTYRHGVVHLLEPEDTVRLADGHRPRVVAALRELPEDQPVLAEAVNAARRLDGELVLLHAVPLSFAERSVGLDRAVERGERMLTDATAQATAAGRSPEEARLVRTRPTSWSASVPRGRPAGDRRPPARLPRPAGARRRKRDATCAVHGAGRAEDEPGAARAAGPAGTMTVLMVAGWAGTDDT